MTENHPATKKQLQKRFKEDPYRKQIFHQMNSIINSAPTSSTIIFNGKTHLASSLPEPYNTMYNDLQKTLKEYEKKNYPELFKTKS